MTKVYPGDISEVDKIELIDGGTGERKIVEEKEIINRWIQEIKDIELIPDNNQEERAGYRFGISLYEGDEIKLGFIPNQINRIYYKSNNEFGNHIKTFFEEQFGRVF
ncbi:hypothetical protein M6D81_22950 [Paenibacillus sp. J5C_2022]|uniref:hypothetical protein n=1 Tax=Paenibacillus sp. J5C2022 TaxID=2977129 RepID=UPI0021D25D10|nr:hypothetical protein [Paenibacillus sp. J5C2022]MCU6711559.1 hypothetical protein [Paenibacillus sp. J5C2022]